MRRAIFTVCIFFCAGVLYAQHIKQMDFRAKPIADILLALADSAGTSIILDETVNGQATFHFSDSEFEEALVKFTQACRMHAVEKDGIWYISRIKAEGSPGELTVNAEAVDSELLVKTLSRNLGVTVLYDQLPKQEITLFIESANLQEVLELVVKKFPEYAVLYENSAYYLRRQNEGNTRDGRLGSSSIKKTGDLYTMQILKGNFSQIVSLLFKTAGREFSLLNRNETAVENLYFTGKNFDELLHLVCEQGNSDFTVKDGLYYIFEIQRKDVVKKLKETRVIELQNSSASDIAALMPAEYSSSSFVKVQSKTNSLYLSGSAEELDPIEEFIKFAEEKTSLFKQKVYPLKFIKSEEFQKLLPKHLADSVQMLPGGNSFAALVNESMDGQIREFLELIDKSGGGTAVRLKYINSEELFKNLPPSAAESEIKTTSDPTLVFYTGTPERKKLLDGELALIDRVKPQIRYQILVIQYQKSKNMTWDPSLSVNPVNSSEHIAGNFSNILNVNFDIISALGQNFAAQLNWQLGEDRARVLADTTLNGLSGQEIKFENTTTFRYLDVAIDPETGKPLYTGTTREINSGLSIAVNGWVSGDGMITMKVDAKVSKQDEASSSSQTNPPPTSERAVNTQVRTKSGAPIIIGGLMQIEKTESENKLPLFGHIPLLGYLFRKRVVSDISAEMVIYIVPHVYSTVLKTEDAEVKCETYLKRFGGMP
jgi:type II secretory pathway component GspD/PulD (secretin)